LPFESRQRRVEGTLLDGQRVSRDCSMRCRMPYPCNGPSDTAFRISKSSVPGSGPASDRIINT
jgi:hypothetical protein